MSQPGAAQQAGFDLDGYLGRIGYSGPRIASTDTLARLHLLHPLAIPFENLDPFLGRPVGLDPAALQEKLVRGGRGGYCYEHNLLFWHALEALGFDVSGLAARVVWGRTDDTPAPRSHMLLRVACEGRIWLADVGFGGMTQTAPLLLEPGRVQPTPHEPFRIVGQSDGFIVQVEVGGEWRTLYRFDLAPYYKVDYAVPNYYLSTNPTSHFVTGLIAARTFPDRRHALADNRFAVHRAGRPSERRTLASAGELAQVLESEFGIALPDRAAFERQAVARGIVPGGTD